METGRWLFSHWKVQSYKMQNSHQMVAIVHSGKMSHHLGGQTGVALLGRGANNTHTHTRGFMFCAVFMQ